MPAVFETHGFLHEDTRQVLRLISQHVTNTAQLGTDVSENDLTILRGSLLASYYTRISVVLQRAVVNCISNAAIKVMSKPSFTANNPGFQAPSQRIKVRAHVIIGSARRSRYGYM